MTTAVEELVERLWPDRTVRISRLTGGMTNANFLADFGDEQVVVRMPGKDTGLLGIDRHHEAQANRLAASIGVAPEVLVESEDEGYLVTRFLPGRPLAPSELASEPMLGEVARTLRLVHGAGTIETDFNPFDVVSQYHDIAASRGITEPFDYPSALSVIDQILVARPYAPAALCHNDLLTENFLYDDKLRILDWEYAGMGDPYFDLASFSITHELSDSADAALLTHYFGQCDTGSLAVLNLMKLVSVLREAMWGVVQLAISEIDIDFADYTRRNVQRLERLLEAMDFTELVELATAANDGAVDHHPDKSDNN
jgi:thiamine kinase-like enzyme